MEHDLRHVVSLEATRVMVMATVEVHVALFKASKVTAVLVMSHGSFTGGNGVGACSYLLTLVLSAQQRGPLAVALLLDFLPRCYLQISCTLVLAYRDMLGHRLVLHIHG